MSLFKRRTWSWQVRADFMDNFMDLKEGQLCLVVLVLVERMKLVEE